MQSDLKLGLLTGSRAKTDAWLFSAMLFPFCLAGSQEEQGLECEPFGGGLRPPLLGCFAGAGLAGAACPREVAEDIPGASGAALYLEQSVSWEGKGNAAVRDTRGHFSSISIWHRRAQGQRSQGGGGLFPQEHGLSSQSERFRVPTGTNTCMGVWGTRAACPALGHGVTTPAISLGGVKPLTNRPELARHG